jgi:hypothetical protein
MLEWLDIGWIEILSIFASVSLLGYVYYRLKVGPRMTAHAKKHRHKEIKLLDQILIDIRDNTHEWTPVAYVMAEMKDASLINDKKNMCVIMGSDGTSVVIKINIKSAAKYREDTTETIATQIRGNHVLKFKKAAEQYIDSRGKELDFIDRLLKKKI